MKNIISYFCRQNFIKFCAILQNKAITLVNIQVIILVNILAFMLVIELIIELVIML